MELGVVRSVGSWIGKVNYRSGRNRVVKLYYVASLNLKRRLLEAFREILAPAFDRLRNLLLVTSSSFGVLLLVALPEDVFLEWLEFLLDR